MLVGKAGFFLTYDLVIEAVTENTSLSGHCINRMTTCMPQRCHFFTVRYAQSLGVISYKSFGDGEDYVALSLPHGVIPIVIDCHPTEGTVIIGSSFGSSSIDGCH